MKKIFAFAACLLFATACWAQSGPPPHGPLYTVQIGFTASTLANATYNVYEGAGGCPVTTSARIGQVAAGGTNFTDPTQRSSGPPLSSGGSNPAFEYCYMITAVSTVGIEGPIASLTVDLTAPPIVVGLHASVQ